MAALEITRMHLYGKNGVQAFFDVNIKDVLILRNMRLMTTKDGDRMYVAVPQQPRADDKEKWADQYSFCWDGKKLNSKSKKLHDAILKVAEAKYKTMEDVSDDSDDDDDDDLPF